MGEVYYIKSLVDLKATFKKKFFNNILFLWRIISSSILIVFYQFGYGTSTQVVSTASFVLFCSLFKDTNSEWHNNIWSPKWIFQLQLLKKKKKKNRTGFLNMLKKCNVDDEKDTYTPIVSKTLDTACRSEAVTEVTKHTLTR